MDNVINEAYLMTRQPNSTWVVNRWVVPNGCDYHLARPQNFFFPDQKTAESYAARWSMPPEMADAMSIERHDMIQHLTEQARQRRIAQCGPECARCGHNRDSHIDRFDAVPGQCDTWVAA